MKTKEELIKESYGEYYNQVKDNLKQNGGIHPIYLDNESGSLLDCIDMYQVSVVEWRPKSLQGIENNNGWIKIESEEDLPKEDFSNVWIKHNEGDIMIMQCSNKYLLKNCTHYQPIVKPKPPLY